MYSRRRKFAIIVFEQTKDYKDLFVLKRYFFDVEFDDTDALGSVELVLSVLTSQAKVITFSSLESMWLLRVLAAHLFLSVFTASKLQADLTSIPSTCDQ